MPTNPSVSIKVPTTPMGTTLGVPCCGLNRFVKSTGTMEAWTLTVMFILCGTSLTCADSDLETDFRVLSKQVTVLLDKRREDMKSIEHHIMKAIFDTPEMMDIRNEIKKLRSEVQHISSGKVIKSQMEKNDVITVKWLYNTVAELKTEVTEIQNSLNSSAIFENHEHTETELTLLKSDVANMNAELGEDRRKQARNEADLQILNGEFRTARENWRSTAVMCGKMKNQLKATQLEWNQNWMILNEKSPSLENEITEHPSRHKRVLKQHIIRLEKSSKTLHKENYYLKSKLLKMEDEMRNLQKKLKWNDNVAFLESKKEENLATTEIQNNLVQQVANLTRHQSKNTEAISSLKGQMSNFDKLHLSMLELLENVETIENKVDKSFPEFRKEISKLEIQQSETSSAVSLFREDQKNIIDSMKAIGFTVSNMQDKTNEDREHLKKMEGLVENLAKSSFVQTSKLHDHILKEESSSINLNATKATIHLVQELKSFESEYKSIVNKLPKDCSTVEGPPGIYLISPGEAEPILAHCDDGWTTIQKRNDGSINFNRNWNEYSNGFGSATGEHWLGNINLHLLTKLNCSQLQINMKDIYGKYWQANYGDFRVADYSMGFKLNIGRYAGNASDALDYQNSMEFSTIDNDRDISNTHCASNYEGGWWFSHCQHANLNGRYNLGLTWFDSSRNEWIAVSNSEMRVKRRDVC